MKKRVILTVTSDLAFDQRVMRVAQTLQEGGWQVKVIGRKKSDSVNLERKAWKQIRLPMLFQKGKLFYLFFNYRLFWRLLFSPADVFHANDLDTLLATFLAAKIRGKILVYDSHEYFTEVPELVSRPKVKAVWERLEQWVFPKIGHAFTVNQSIAEVYEQKYGVPVKVLRNLPFRQSEGPYPVPKDKWLIYQGALNLGRGIDLMLRALVHLPEEYRLRIVGSGDVEPDLHRMAKELGLESRVDFTGRIRPVELAGPQGLTAQAVLGLSLEEDLGLNYRFALPNKLFDYVQARVPVLVSDLPEMRRIVEKHGVGRVLKDADRTPEGLANAITDFCDREEDWTQARLACKTAAERLCWDSEREILLDTYSQFSA